MMSIPSHHVHLTLALIILLFSVSVAPTAATSGCRCRPWEQCWPRLEDWSRLNSSLNGHLIELRPVASVCHEPSLDQPACNVVRRMNNSALWRAGQPGALVNRLWECPLGYDETCCHASQQDQPCHQGRIPLYSAVVESTDEVQTAVKFARKHNVRLIIRNTGHDAAGSSSGPDSFQISTSRLKDIQYHENFRLTGSNTSTGPAVTFGAGVLFQELYTQGKQKGFTVTGGDTATVGAAGGFVQGGGVPDYLAYTWGLAVDNVLEFEIVTASGELVIAHAGQHPDLFWSLRGGGGGTFGVVVRVTMRAYPDSPAVKSTITTLGDAQNPSFWFEDIAGLLAALQSLNHQGIAGMFRLMQTSAGFLGAIDVCFLSQSAVEDTDRLIKATLGSAARKYNISSTALASLSSDFDATDPPANTLFGSMLISNELFQSKGGPRLIAERMSRIRLGEGEFILTSNLGGQVSDNGNREADTPLHPAWRSSAHLVSLTVIVGTAAGAREKAMQRLTNELMPGLYSLDPSQRVSYRNMGDPNQPNFKDVYWGSANYDRLTKIKRDWDPTDLFISRGGVGSERWDSEGLCRV